MKWFSIWALIIKSSLKNTISQIPDIGIKNEIGQETPDILRCEHQMSNMIFQTISDIYEKYDNIDVEWLNTFKDLLKSNILRNNWNYLKNEYNNKTKEFINTLLI